MNRDKCNEFFMFPTRNPLTNRLIKPRGPTYNKLMRTCSGSRPRSPRSRKPIRRRSRSRSRSKSRSKSRSRSRSRSRSKSPRRIVPRYHPSMVGGRPSSSPRRIVPRYHPSMMRKNQDEDDDLNAHYMFNY